MRPARSVEYKGYTIRIVIHGARASGFTWAISIHKERWADPVHVTTDREPFKDAQLANAFALETAQRWIDKQKSA